MKSKSSAAVDRATKDGSCGRKGRMGVALTDQRTEADIRSQCVMAGIRTFGPHLSRMYRTGQSTLDEKKISWGRVVNQPWLSN